jgi:hypothetical protein
VCPHLLVSPLHQGLEVYDIGGVIPEKTFKGTPIAFLVRPPEQNRIKAVHAVDIRAARQVALSFYRLEAAAVAQSPQEKAQVYMGRGKADARECG